MPFRSSEEQRPKMSLQFWWIILIAVVVAFIYYANTETFLLKHELLNPMIDIILKFPMGYYYALHHTFLTY